MLNIVQEFESPAGEFLNGLPHLKDHPFSCAIIPNESSQNRSFRQKCTIFNGLGDILYSHFGGSSGPYNKATSNKIKQTLNIFSYDQKHNKFRMS